MEKRTDNREADIVTAMQVIVWMKGCDSCFEWKGSFRAMADINGYPFFDYQLKLLKRWKFRKFLFLIEDGGSFIEDYYGDGSKWQVDIQYFYNKTNQTEIEDFLENAKEKLEEDFLLLYGNIFMDIDYQELVYRYQIEKSAGKIGVEVIQKEKNQNMNSGVFLLSKKIFTSIEKKERLNLIQRLTNLSKVGKIAVWVVSEKFYKMENLNSIEEFCTYAKKRFCEKRKAVFLDRDGVINELIFNDNIEQIDSPFAIEDFKYKQNVISTLLFIQKKGFYIFIVTNQPAAAKGKVSLTRLYDLNKWMVQDLKSKDILVEFVNICPHHPEKSQYSKVPFLIRKCNCRKPEAGLITDLLQVYNIDLSQSYMVGDSYTDIIAGKKAGLNTILIGNWKCDACQRLQGNKPDKIVEDISELKNII